MDTWCHDPVTSMSDIQLFLKKISDLEAFWRTRERLMQSWYESSSVSASSEPLRMIEPAVTEEAAGAPLKDNRLTA